MKDLLKLFLKPASENIYTSTIYVRIQYNYGKKMIYPVCDTANFLASIARTKTLTDNSIKQVKELGYTIRVLSDLPETL